MKTTVTHIAHLSKQRKLKNRAAHVIGAALGKWALTPCRGSPEWCNLYGGLFASLPNLHAFTCDPADPVI